MMKQKLLNNLKNYRLTYIIGVYLNIFIYNYLIDSMRFLRFYLVKNKLIKNHFSELKKFKNIHKGQKCFIVSTGPSLKYEDLDLIKNEYSFSVNSIIKAFEKTDWRPTYYGIQDMLVYDQLKNDIEKCGLKYIFISDYIYKKYKPKYKNFPFYHFNYFHGSHPQICSLRTNFSEDVSNIIYDGYTITYSLLQIAIYMGFKEIYLLGSDCSYDTKKQHFIESGHYDKNYQTAGSRMIYAFQVAKKYADKNGIKIYNATRGGMLEVFDRVDLNVVVKNKN